MTPLDALLDALERGRCVFWTGQVVVEFDRSYVPSGPVTLVLDEDDFRGLVKEAREPARGLFASTIPDTREDEAFAELERRRGP